MWDGVLSSVRRCSVSGYFSAAWLVSKSCDANSITYTLISLNGPDDTAGLKALFQQDDIKDEAPTVGSGPYEFLKQLTVMYRGPPIHSHGNSFHTARKLPSEDWFSPSGSNRSRWRLSSSWVISSNNLVMCCLSSRLNCT